MRVFIYRNLNRKGIVFSLKALDGPHKGLVYGYASEILLKDVAFEVSESGRQRVLRDKKKNVHAGVEGTIVSIIDPIERIPGVLSKCSHKKWDDDKIEGTRHKVFYNPYKYETFVNENKIPLLVTTTISFRPTGISTWVSEEDQDAVDFLHNSLKVRRLPSVL